MKQLISVLSVSLFLAACGGKSSPVNSGNSLPGTTTTFNVTASHAPTSYTFNGTDNPTITLSRGLTYVFNLSVSGHPFYIMSVQGTNTGNAYSSGVTGNGNVTGQLIFAVPAGAPPTLFYNCSIHAAMTGQINVVN